MNAVSPTRAKFKKATNLSLDAALLEEARTLGINISQACEAGLARQVAEARSDRWLQDNADAIEASNAYVEKHGLPLERFRNF